VYVYTAPTWGLNHFFNFLNLYFLLQNIRNIHIHVCMYMYVYIYDIITTYMFCQQLCHVSSKKSTIERNMLVNVETNN
jgi:hypothetical protein